MEKVNIRNVVPMEDEEDLELLRMAALKTLHKKECASIPEPPHQATHSHPPIIHPMNIVENRSIPVLNHVRPPMDNSYYPPIDPVQPNLIHHPVLPYVNAGFEKMEINEPYVPQRIHPTPTDNSFIAYPNYNASSVTSPGETNVQLSPRSAAFVLANKEIIERRRGVSKSPEPYRRSPGRWSRSPSRESWKYRRSVSRSPSYHNRSPIPRDRSITPLPPPSRRRHSPGVSHSRKSRSRSPIPRNQSDTNYHRNEKKSPIRNRGNPSTYNNRNDRKFRGNEIPPHRGENRRKSNSPRTNEEINMRNKRKTQSPQKTDIKRRSTSRSPNRKYPRNNTNLRRGRRSPPPKRFNPNNNNRQNNSNPRNRNYNARRSTSPTHNNRHNNSRTPPNQPKRKTLAENEDESRKPTENELKSERNENKEVEHTSNKKPENGQAADVPKEKTEQEIEDELLASSDDDKSNSDDDNDDDDDDGIDLFASEESESENEGRFKSSSSKSERKANVQTVSFSELGKTAAPSTDVLRDLDDVHTDSIPTHRKGRRENGRDNDTRAGASSRRHGQRYNEKRSYNDWDRERGNRERENRDSNRSIGSRRRNSDNDPSNGRTERKPISLKSTESEAKRKTPERAKSTETKDRAGEEKRAVTLKRSSKNIDKDGGARSLQSTISGPSTKNEKQRSRSPVADTSNGSTTKKSIRDRLGAMTTTWKSNKKSWKSEKV